MPFQENAEKIRSKAHLSTVKPPVLIGLCAISLVVIIMVLQGFWSTLSGSSFEVAKQDSPNLEAETLSAEEGEPDHVTRVEEPDGQHTVSVHIGGAVAAPGVYEVQEGSRVKAAIDAAGGLRDDAAADAVNLARVVCDGEQIIVPTIDEASASEYGAAQDQKVPNGKVNINSASLPELTSLPGIGESTAQKIIADRESKGPFTTPDDIKRVSGIGEKKYELLADLICV